MKQTQNLFWYFVASQALLFLTPFLATTLIRPISVGYALAVHTLALLSFVVGYGFNMGITKRSRYRSAARPFMPTRMFWLAAYLFALFGTGVAILQVAIFRDPIDYLKELLTGGYNINIRNEFLTSASQGGLSGAIKMWGYAPLSMYLSSSGLLTFADTTPINKRKLRRLNRTALLLTGVKVLFALDRLTIMAVILANIFVVLRKLNSLKPVFFVVGSVLLSSFVSQKRLEGYGNFDFLVLYAKLGIVNLQLMLETLEGHTYGFATILSPLKFILKFLGLPPIDPPSTFAWEWGAAHYLVGYAYQDFGPLYWLFFFLLGFMYRKIDREALLRRNMYYMSIYFIVLFSTISYIGVPVFKNIDFWLALILPLILIKLFVRKPKSKASASELSTTTLHVQSSGPQYSAQ